MSEDNIRELSNIDKNSIEAQLAVYCSPVIAGLKESNLIILTRQNAAHLIQTMKKTHISVYPLCTLGNRVTMLVYHEDELKKYLDLPATRDFLATYNYDPNSDLKELLTMFKQRYKLYFKNRKEFPHEMGIFLGYPIEDVTGFVNNEGKNFLYCGYWKVYANVEEKVKIFDSYDAARDEIIKLLSSGVDIIQIAQSFVA